jgi:signal transduction histidine kinase
LFGVGSPLVLATVSTAILIGILYPLPFAVLPAGVLLLVHAVQTLADHRTGRDDFVVGLGMTTVLAVMVLVGQAVRRIQDGERRALARLSVEREAAAAERERVRLAREVHDGMAKSLQGLALVAAGLPAWVERDADRAMTQARCLAEGAAQAVEEARSLLAQLRTDDVALPLDAVVRQLCDQWSVAAGRPVAVDARSVPDIGVQPRYEVLAALREALENVRRHAPDAQVSVTFGPDGGGLRAEVVDDGPGFAPVTLQLSEAHGHFGVRGMHERLASIGGSARVDSASGRGTRVLLRLPAPGAPVAASGARRGRRLARLRRARLARVVRRSQVAR